jgi:NADH dehydrogenase [ubiquinone] 1 alpha subcomplex assembly factor 7
VSPLARSIERRIAATGPIPVADFMAEALLHPAHGYYAKADPFGTAGDFTTAPEVSQIFGELIGLWCVEMWQRAGAPASFALAELGPGRGTLMADALRAARVVPDFRAAATVHLVEASPTLRAVQAKTLADAAPVWHETAASLPEMPTFLIANEFFDALPVHQFVLRDGAWRERMVVLAEDAEMARFALAETAAPSPRARLIDDAVTTAAEEGDIAELCPAAVSIAADLAGHLAEFGGAALIVDYGDAEPVPKATLQSLRGHARHDFLDDPGSADITAHVDFAALIRAASPVASCWGPLAQGELLERLGLDERARRLGENATEAQRRDLEQACRRLIAPEEMGTLFKALALTPKDAPPPPAFEQL